jgi:hypothetical protein
MNDNNKLPNFLRRTRLSSTAEPGPSDQDLNAAERATLEQTLRDSPFAVVLGAAGHSRACVQRIRSGRSMICSCEATQEAPDDDAAAAVGRAIHFARMTKTRQIPMPPGVVARLIEHVDAGNAAATLVWEWLVRRGQIPQQNGSGPKLRPSLRILSKRS